jgi:hypothetical protein
MKNQYNVTVFTSKHLGGIFHTYMVNGEVVRWDDYDYSDPDFHRQEAMSQCARHLDNGNYCGNFGKYLPLSEVVGNLKVEGFWMGEVVPMSDEEAFLAQFQILAAIVRLNDKDGCESFDLSGIRDAGCGCCGVDNS